jgi:hypothetical protein
MMCSKITLPQSADALAELTSVCKLKLQAYELLLNQLNIVLVQYELPDLLSQIELISCIHTEFLVPEGYLTDMLKVSGPLISMHYPSNATHNHTSESQPDLEMETNLVVHLVLTSNFRRVGRSK